MSSDALRIKRNYESARQRIEEVAGHSIESKAMLEMYAGVVRDLMQSEDEGWVQILGGIEQTRGFTLDDVIKTTEYLERQTKLQGGLLGRGLRLKNNHVFGRGFTFERKDGEKIQPRYQRIIDDPNNQDALFSPKALKSLNRVIFTSGNPILLYDTREKKWQSLSVAANIDNVIAQDDDSSKIKYFLRKYDRVNELSAGSMPEVVKEWVPNSNYWLTRPKFPDTITINNEAIPVRKDLVIVHVPFNCDNGERWGVPDAFSAAPWATIYANYLRDGAKLQRALAAISYLVKAKTERAAKSASAKMSSGRIGQAAITGPDTEVSALPRAGAIDLYEGRPLQAQVAANLDVSATGIASDPGPGGSYASEQALSQPEQMAALSRQEDFDYIFEKCFAVMGAPEIKINFRRLDTDPVHRQLQSLGLSYTMGGINQQELRVRSLELLDIDPTEQKLPEPNEFTGSKAASLQGGLTADPDPDNRDDSGVPAQGRSGPVGSLDDSGNDAANSDRDAGTA